MERLEGWAESVGEAGSEASSITVLGNGSRIGRTGLPRSELRVPAAVPCSISPANLSRGKKKHRPHQMVLVTIHIDRSPSQLLSWLPACITHPSTDEMLLSSRPELLLELRSLPGLMPPLSLVSQLSITDLWTASHVLPPSALISRFRGFFHLGRPNLRRHHWW